jgi:hypothetical protein
LFLLAVGITAGLITSIIFFIDIGLVASVRSKVKNDTSGDLQLDWGNAVSIISLRALLWWLIDFRLVNRYGWYWLRRWRFGRLSSALVLVSARIGLFPRLSVAYLRSCSVRITFSYHFAQETWEVLDPDPHMPSGAVLCQSLTVEESHRSVMTWS